MFSKKKIREENQRSNKSNLEVRLDKRYEINVRIANKTRKRIINMTIIDEIITTKIPTALTI